MNAVQALRKIIREEVKKAIREELGSLIVESKKIQVPKQQKAALEKSVVGRLRPQPKEMPVYSDDPIKQLLAETAYGMNPEEYRTMTNMDSSMAQGFPQMFMQERESHTSAPQPQVVESVSDMLASARPSTDINQVEIDAVPDFTEMMQTLKAKGKL